MKHLSTQEILTLIGILALLGVFLFSGCMTVEVNPETGLVKVNTLLKDVEADKFSVSVMDAEGNGKTFDMSNYNSTVADMMLQFYNMGLSVGEARGAK